MHQMGLAEPDPAIKEKRVERHHANRAGAGFGDPPGRGMGELVGLADDEVLEGEARVERRGLRLVFAKLEREAGCGDRARWRTVFHLVLAAAGFRRPGRRRRHHDDRNPFHLPVLRAPQRQNPVGIMRRDPVAKKAGGRADDCLPAIDALHADRGEPAAVGGLADLLFQLAEDPVPLGLQGHCRAFGAICLNRFRHYRIPPDQDGSTTGISAGKFTSAYRKYFLVFGCPY